MRAGSVAPAPSGFLLACFLLPGASGAAARPGLPAAGIEGLCPELGKWDGGLCPPLWKGVPRLWRRKLNRARGNVSGEEKRPGPGGSGSRVGDAWVGRVQCAWPDHTGVQRRGGGRPSGAGAEPARPLGRRRGAHRLGSWGAEGAGAGPPEAVRSPARSPAPGREQLRARGPGPLFGDLITRERLPRASCRHAGAVSLGAGGAEAWGCPPCHPRLHPLRAANGAQPAQG